jgi:hypothetical protein
VVPKPCILEVVVCAHNYAGVSGAKYKNSGVNWKHREES